MLLKDFSSVRRYKSYNLVKRVFLISALIMTPPVFGNESLTVYPSQLNVNRGFVSDQGVQVLSVADQHDASDDWLSYLEFYPAGKGFSGILTFDVPEVVNFSDTTKLELVANYRGPDRKEQAWRWHIRNHRTNRWEKLGDNSGVMSWEWSQIQLIASGDLNRLVDIFGRIELRYSSPTNYDDSNLDAVAINLDLVEMSAAQEQPVQEQPVQEQPVQEQPVEEEPVQEQPVQEQPVQEEPVQEQPESTTGVWQPSPGTSWQWQLTGDIDTSFEVQMYDIDLFDVNKSVIDSLHMDNRVVICYFSAGSWEDWRPDSNSFPDTVKGRTNGWPGEKWLDIRDIDTLGPILGARLDLAVEKGCDGVEPDNVDGYSNNTGLPLTYQHQLNFNMWLADQAHARGLSIGLKNDLEQVQDLEPYFDWALNEQCNQYDECELLSPFVAAGKAVFGVEYSGNLGQFCSTTNALDFDWLKKDINLGAARESCR